MECHFFRAVDIAMLVSPLVISSSYFLFVMSVFSFVGLFKFFGVSLVMVWCVTCAGGVFRVPVLCHENSTSTRDTPHHH
jgi:hypothetical protein